MKMSITKLIVKLHEDGLPKDIFAVFSDGQRLSLNYQQTWRQCFASLSGESRSFMETAYRHNLPAEIETTKMTRQDWANVCFAYRLEMEE